MHIDNVPEKRDSDHGILQTLALPLNFLRIAETLESVG